MALFNKVMNLITQIYVTPVKVHNCRKSPFKNTLTMTHKLPKEQTLFDCADSIESLRCRQCVNFETHSLVHLNYHFKIGHALSDSYVELYECISCNFQTYSQFLFSRHRLLNLCMIDWEIKSEASTLEESRDKNQTNLSNDDKLVSCEHCPYTTKNIYNLKRHVLTKHTDPDEFQWFECAQCSHRSKTKCGLKKHVNYKHGNVNYHCGRCLFETKSKPKLNYHVLSKHTEPDKIQWFECAQCSYKSKDKSSLKQHVEYMHDDNKESLKCDHCPFETKYKHSLKDHTISKHTESEQIQWSECAQCSLKFKRKSELKQHADRMHGDRKCLKCEHCQFETKHKRWLKDHVLSKHTDPADIQWFECAQCAYKSHRKDTLKRHTDRMHANKAKLKCDRCEFETKLKASLADHVLKKHSDQDGMEWFHCEHCPYKNPFKDNLRKHVKRMHSVATTK